MDKPTKAFATIIAQVLETGTPHKLDRNEQAYFYQDLERHLSDRVDQIRSEKRKAYEQFKNISVS